MFGQKKERKKVKRRLHRIGLGVATRVHIISSRKWWLKKKSAVDLDAVVVVSGGCTEPNCTFFSTEDDAAR